MADITFTIPDEKLSRVIAAIKGFNPKESGFTDNEWAKEVVRRWIRDQVARWEQLTAQQAIAYLPDDTIVS